MPVDCKISNTIIQHDETFHSFDKWFIINMFVSCIVYNIIDILFEKIRGDFTI